MPSRIRRRGRPRRPLPPRRLRALATQGYDHVAPEILASAAPALRLTLGACGTGALVGALLGRSWLPWLLALTSLAGAFGGLHPMDRAGSWLFQRMGWFCPVPRHSTPRRVTFAAFALAFLLAGLAFHAGWPGVGRSLGLLHGGVAWVGATTDALLPAWIHRRVRKRPSRPGPLAPSGPPDRV